MLHLSYLFEDRLKDELSTATGLEMTTGCLTLLIRELQTWTDDVSAWMDESRPWEFTACDAGPLQLRVSCIIVAVMQHFLHL